MINPEVFESPPYEPKPHEPVAWSRMDGETWWRMDSVRLTHLMAGAFAPVAVRLANGQLVRVRGRW